jgi:2-methylcitrate dehydratase PrpD
VGEVSSLARWGTRQQTEQAIFRAALAGQAMMTMARKPFSSWPKEKSLCSCGALALTLASQLYVLEGINGRGGVR